MSASDAVDGSSTSTRVPRMWEHLRLPTIWMSYQFRRLLRPDWTSPSRLFRFMAPTPLDNAAQVKQTTAYKDVSVRGVISFPPVVPG